MNALTGALLLLTLLPLLGGGDRRAVGWSTIGAFLVILGVAAALPDWSALAAAPQSFVAVSAGFVWLGLVGFGVAGWSASRNTTGLAIARFGAVGANAAMTVAVLVVIDLLYETSHLLHSAGWRGMVAALGLGGSAAVFWTLLGLSRAGKGVRWIDERWLARHWPESPCLPERSRQVLLTVVLSAVATAALSGNLLVAVTGAMIAVVGAHRLAREAGRAARLPLQPILAALGLLTFAWLAATIAGGEIPLSLPGILDSPLSETAEALLALFLGIGAWALLGLFPFHGTGPGSALALVGGAFLIRWGIGFVPNGMAHAMPVFGIVAAVAVLHAAATGRAGEYAAAFGVLALGAGAGTWGLFALASVLAGMRLYGVASPVPGIDRRQLGGMAMIPALAFVLPTALRGETFLTLLAVVAGMVLFRPSAEERRANSVDPQGPRSHIAIPNPNP